MVEIETYSNVWGTNNLDSIMDKFISTLINTNRSYSFFVEWAKVKANAEKYNVEINILNSLVGSENIKVDLRTLLKKYPEVTPVIPLIIAVRELRLKVVEDFSATDVDIKEFLFEKRKSLSEKEIEDIVNFCDKTGLFGIFQNKNIRNLKDYILGVEVGMDTNARKNRSGSAMELILDPVFEKLSKKYKFNIISQKQFKSLSNSYPELLIPTDLKDRKFDYLLIKGKIYINVEANYYAGGGSKPQEIVDSYINRMNELKNSGWHFIWITDGDGWITGKNQIRKAFEKQDYVININFIRKGGLEKIIGSFFG